MRIELPLVWAFFICLPDSILGQDSALPAKAPRLQAKDSDGDGRLSREELGDQLWKRVLGHDANGNGALDPAEWAAVAEKGRRGKSGQARPGGANLSFVIREHRGTNGFPLRYSLFVPTQPGPSSPLPLVLCLHGAGGNTDAANRLASPEMQAKHPCIVMAPACDGKNTRWVSGGFRQGDTARAVLPELMEALDAVLAETGADRGRLYLTGQSMGGVGTWGLLAAHPDKFAAAIPVCGLWNPEDAPKMNGVAIWAFHGDQDTAVPVSGSREMIAALKKAGVTPAPKYTEFSGIGHGSWGPAYEKAELWDWLFVQKR